MKAARFLKILKEELQKWSRLKITVGVTLAVTRLNHDVRNGRPQGAPLQYHRNFFTPLLVKTLSRILFGKTFIRHTAIAFRTHSNNRPRLIDFKPGCAMGDMRSTGDVGAFR